MGAKRKLNYRIHDDNPVEVAAKYITDLFVEVNVSKIDALLREHNRTQETSNHIVKEDAAE